MESQPQNPEFRISPENFHPCLFVLKIPQTAKVIWGRNHSLKSHPIDKRSRGSNLQPLVYKVSSLSTTAAPLSPM